MTPKPLGFPIQALCPACEQPLRAVWDGDLIWVYCTRGSCPDSDMNEGFLAETQDLAIKGLVNRYDENHQ